MKNLFLTVVIAVIIFLPHILLGLSNAYVILCLYDWIFIPIFQSFERLEQSPTYIQTVGITFFCYYFYSSVFQTEKIKSQNPTAIGDALKLIIERCYIKFLTQLAGLATGYIISLFF
jgi:hypothetical protein